MGVLRSRRCFKWLRSVRHVSVLALADLLLACAPDPRSPADPEFSIECPAGNSCIFVEYAYQKEPVGGSYKYWGILSRWDNVPGNLAETFSAPDRGYCDFAWHFDDTITWYGGIRIEHEQGAQYSELAVLYEGSNNNINDFWLYGARHFESESGSYLYGILGVAYPGQSPGKRAPASFRFLSIAVRETDLWIDSVDPGFSGIVYDWVVAHELGHSVAGLKDVHEAPFLHAEPEDDQTFYYCVMWSAEGPAVDYWCDPSGGTEQTCLVNVIALQTFCGHNDRDAETTCRQFLIQSCTK